MFKIIAVSVITGALFLGCDSPTDTNDDKSTSESVVDSINVDYKGENNAVFYSLATKEQVTVKHDVWDIAVDGELNIVANSGDYGMGVTVFPTTITDFDTDLATYVDSAFGGVENRSYEGTDLFAGWMSFDEATHSVSYAKNLYVVKTEDGSFYKLQLTNATMRTGVSVTAKIAGLSGTEAVETVFTKDADYDRVYIDLGTKAAVDFAPKSKEWDLKFARGEQKVDKDGVLIPYAMSAISINSSNSVEAYVVENKSLEDVSSVTESEFSTSINTIGNSWYTFDSKTFTFSADKDVSVLKTENGTYKLKMATFGIGFNSIFEFAMVE